MSQHDYNIANGGGAAVRADLNNALLAILSQNSGATAPTTTKPFMFWYDTTVGVLKMRNAADTAWIAAIDGVANGNPVGMKNRIINGAMMIDQRNAGASVAVTGNLGQMSVDRMMLAVWGSATGRFSAQQSSVAPAGFLNSLLATVTTADASPSAAYAYSVGQMIEGLNVADLGWGSASASAVTISFWVRSSVTGTFPVVLQNADLNRAYGATYTISAANTWEQKTITIAGDTSGTWLKTNATGINLQFGLGAGSSRTISGGSWGTTGGSTQLNVTGCTNLMATNGATFYITGVQLEKGSIATAFDWRPYGQELQLCQRYYYKLKANGADGFFGSGVCESSTNANAYTQFPVTMRTAPTALEQSGTASDYAVQRPGANTTCSSVPTFNGAEAFATRTYYTVSSGLTAGQACLLRSLTSNAYLAWSAEL